MITNLDAPEFDQAISLRDAYRCMEVFIDAYVKRGDGAVSEFLDFYVSTAADALATNSRGPQDFLNTLRAVRRGDSSKRPKADA